MMSLLLDRPFAPNLGPRDENAVNGSRSGACVIQTPNIGYQQGT